MAGCASGPPGTRLEGSALTERTIVSQALTVVVAIVAGDCQRGGLSGASPPVSLLSSAARRPRISPNGRRRGRHRDHLLVGATANVSITLEAEDGRFAFRQDGRRTPGDYRVLFSGIVDGYVLDGEDIPGGSDAADPNGTYTWTIVAENDDGARRSAGRWKS